MGTIQILKNRAGKYYVRVKHDNGRVLCHCQAIKQWSNACAYAQQITNQYYNFGLTLSKDDKYMIKGVMPAWVDMVKEQRTFFSETYSSRQKAEQGLNAVIRICKEGRIEDLTNIVNEKG